MSSQTRGIPSKRWGKMRYKHGITLKTTGHKIQKFSYWGSQVDYDAKKSELDADDLENALECFVSDAIAGDMDIDEFASEFGYEKVSECITARKACIATRNKLAKLGIEGDDLYNISNALHE